MQPLYSVWPISVVTLLSVIWLSYSLTFSGVTVPRSVDDPREVAKSLEATEIANQGSLVKAPEPEIRRAFNALPTGTTEGGRNPPRQLSPVVSYGCPLGQNPCRKERSRLINLCRNLGKDPH